MMDVYIVRQDCCARAILDIYRTQETAEEAVRRLESLSPDSAHGYEVEKWMVHGS
jgi:hypothetical protein